MKKISFFLLFLFSYSVLADNKSDIDSLFNWAETEFSGVFSPVNQPSQVFEQWYFRYYPITQNYLGVNASNEIWVFGKSWNNEFRYIDTLQSFLPFLPQDNIGSCTDLPNPKAIQNPYYSQALWKIWSLDPKAIDGLEVIEPAFRVFPLKPPQRSDLYLNYGLPTDPDKQYFAGFWDDFYLNQDDNHSRLSRSWDDGNGNAVNKINEQILHAVTDFFDASQLKNWGVTFTSQSSTHMGHDISNQLSRARETEVLYYFSGVLRTGPAYISYNDKDINKTDDTFHALIPSMLNSYGASGSEMNAIKKLLLVGGYFPSCMKQKLKIHGLYPSTLLYIWKAGLPYRVSYMNELRHKVAYLTNPDSVHGYYNSENLFQLKYDEAQHLQNMIEMASSMTIAPPVALLKKISIDGGITVYDQLKTAWLIYQNQETITLNVSTEDSYDLQGMPITYQWTILYGNKNATVTKLSKTDFKITVPYDPHLPKGRTAIMLTVNNGHYDSNPAIINVYRQTGTNNLRPTITGLVDLTIQPGDTIDFNIESSDPEGYPTTLYQWDNEIGTLSGNRFTWTAPDNAAAAKHNVTIISSDGTNGNSYQSRQITIEIKP